MRNSIKRIITVLGLALIAGSTQASVVDITSLVATWQNISPAAGISTTGNGSTLAKMRWGEDTGAGQSGYDFATATTPISNIVPPNSATFAIGTWSHINNPITGTSLASATLKLTAAIDVDSVSQGTFDFLFDFTHNETPNDPPCDATGAGVNINGCADIVDVVFNTLSDNFLVGGTLFTLNIVPGSTHFETIEAATNTFTIMANIASRSSVVPEPSTLALLSLGLFGLGFNRRKRLQ